MSPRSVPRRERATNPSWSRSIACSRPPISRKTSSGPPGGSPAGARRLTRRSSQRPAGVRSGRHRPLRCRHRRPHGPRPRREARAARRDVSPSRSRTTPGRPTPSACSLFTNSRRGVAAADARRLLDARSRDAGALRKLGGPDAPPSTLMFAKFSPDGRRVAYVREHNLYVEDVATPHITQLTSDGSTTLINGTFDWVYEEELNLRDGFRWSPDGQQIAYWQLDASGVRDYDLIDDTDSLYSFVKPVQYPKAGQTNSIGPRRRRQRQRRPDAMARGPRRPAQQLHRPDGLGRQLRRRRAAAPQSPPGHARRDDGRRAHGRGAHDPHGTRQRVGGRGRRSCTGCAAASSSSGSASAMDGATPTSSPATGRRTRLLTPGNFDLTEPNSPFGATVHPGDRHHREAWSTTWPPRTTRHRSTSTALGSTAPADRSASHPRHSTGSTTTRSLQTRGWAFHTYSTFDTPPMTELVRLPDHAVVRTLVDNARLKATIATLARRPHRIHPTGRDGRRSTGCPIRCLDHEAGGFRFHQALPGAVHGVWRPGASDSARPVGQLQLFLPPDARTEGVRGRRASTIAAHRRPAAGRGARPSINGSALSTPRTRRRPPWRSLSARTPTPRASPYGAGATAAR